MRPRILALSRDVVTAVACPSHQGGPCAPRAGEATCQAPALAIARPRSGRATRAALVTCWTVLLLAGTGAAPGQTAAAPKTLSINASVVGPVTVGGPLRFHVSLSNASPHAIACGTTNNLFGWLVLLPERDQAFFSERIALTPATPWPATLLSGATVSFLPVDVSQSSAYRYGQGLKIERGYPVAADGLPPAATGRLPALLKPGQARAKWLVCFPLPDDAPPLLVRGAPIDLTVAPSNAAAATAALLEQFNRDPWSAQRAHDEAVKIGSALLPNLITAVSEEHRPDYARLWLATAIADIPAAQAVIALTALLHDPAADVRCVVGYYGPKQKSATLDQAIVAAAKQGHARFTSYALLGFLVFRGEAPAGLLDAGLDSDDPQARAAAANALSAMASEQNEARLHVLLQDKNDRVRATARRVLDALQPATKSALETKR